MWPQVWPINTHHLILSNFHSESDTQSYIIITRVANFTVKNLILITLLSDDIGEKGLLNLMASSPVATG